MNKKQKNYTSLMMCEEGIRKIFEENNQEFFSYAWRKHIDAFVRFESKYNALLEWINAMLEVQFSVVNALNPADKDNSYTGAMLKDYLGACQDVAVLTNAKTIMLSPSCTTEMRSNIEYTLSKLFQIHYAEGLGYVKNSAYSQISSANKPKTNKA